MEQQQSESLPFEDKLRTMILGNRPIMPSSSTMESNNATKLTRSNVRNGYVAPIIHEGHKQSRFRVQSSRGSAPQVLASKQIGEGLYVSKQSSETQMMEPAAVRNGRSSRGGAARCDSHRKKDIPLSGPEHFQSAHLKAPNRRAHDTHNKGKVPLTQNVPGIWNKHQQYQRKNNHMPVNQTAQVNNYEAWSLQVKFLQNSLQEELPNLEMKHSEVVEKEAFHARLSEVVESAIKSSEGRLSPVDLVCFGSLSSGYATAGSDMDLAVVSKTVSSPLQTALIKDGLPRAFEQALLSESIGARLLTKTRVPILKVCESPSLELLSALREVRRNWEESPEEDAKDASVADAERNAAPDKSVQANKSIFTDGDFPSLSDANKPLKPRRDRKDEPKDFRLEKSTNPEDDTSTGLGTKQDKEKGLPRKRTTKNKSRPRERRPNALDFPRFGVGTQCDINFSNPLAIQNTALLRCYSLCDSRVKPMVQYVKGWAKQRKINSSYSGTLSSYGYVLMVLHYLVNIANPPVLPNLQLGDFAGLYVNEEFVVDRYNVSFWRNEHQICALAAEGRLTNNLEPPEALIRDFFHYYAATGAEVIKYGFNWFQDALSLRTRGGLISKRSKGWIAAKTSTTNNRNDVRHRYLFAIEDPFELDHNVARTVDHNGIVAIRDEFRRAWRIIAGVGRGEQLEERLFAPLQEQQEERGQELQEPHVQGKSLESSVPETSTTAFQKGNEKRPEK